jgi:hypothetical protein
VDQASVEEPEHATQELIGAPAADRCTNCDTPLAPDQRYCVNCGERRGKPRFSFEALVAPPPAPPPQRRRRFQVSSSFSFIAGLATLLLALGVGVLIGHNGNAPKQAASQAPVIKIGNLGGTGTTANTGTTPSTAFKASKVPKLTPKVIKKVQAAAAQVLGSSGVKNLSQNPTQQVGGSCSGGAGCQGGHFTGNFFGP